jgi:putative lipoprotein
VGSALLLGPASAHAQSSGSTDPWFGADKALHFTAGFGLAVGGYTVGALTLDDRWAAAGLGATIAVGVGAAKEGLDAAGLGTPSWKDFTWDIIGTALGIGVSLAFDAALRGPNPP